MTPETLYARRGGLHLAYQVLFEGPPDLLLLDQWFSHMEAQWDVPQLADFRERLASFGRLIMPEHETVRSGAGVAQLAERQPSKPLDLCAVLSRVRGRAYRAQLCAVAVCDS
jgi:hypothetical protein